MQFYGQPLAFNTNFKWEMALSRVRECTLPETCHSTPGRGNQRSRRRPGKTARAKNHAMPRDDAQEAAHAAMVSSMFIRSRICDINKFSKRTAAASTWTLGSGQGDRLCNQPLSDSLAHSGSVTWAEVRASRCSVNEKRERRANINCCHRDGRSAIVLFDDKRIQDASVYIPRSCQHGR